MREHESDRPRRRFHLTTLGETMLRLSPQGTRQIAGSRALTMHAAGAESNVCAALAGLGRRAGWMSRLPDNNLGTWLLAELRSRSVDTSMVQIAHGERLGLLFLEPGVGAWPTRVTYDRECSAASSISLDQAGWDDLLDAEIVHITGITAALSEGNRQLLDELRAKARERGVAISFDVNYRRTLWSPDDASEAILPLAADCDILFCGKDDAAALFALTGDATAVLESLKEMTRAETVVLTLGEKGALMSHAGVTTSVPACATVVVDPLGAGDAFAAGVIDGWLQGSPVEGARQGVLLAALAMAQEGDMLSVSRPELERLLKGEDGVVLR